MEHTTISELVSNYNLFLDDFRQPIDASYYKIDKRYRTESWVTVKNFKEFKETVERNLVKGYWPTLISYDHDLGEEHYKSENQTLSLLEYYNKKDRSETGYDCLKWFIKFSYENKLPFPESLCHSMNPVGSKNIIQLIKAHQTHLKYNKQ